MTGWHLVVLFGCVVMIGLLIHSRISERRRADAFWNQCPGDYRNSE